MIPTYTYAIKEKIIKDYLGSNLVVLLINNNNLGITDAPSSTQLEARQNYNINNLATQEIGAANLNGYKRHVILNNSIVPNIISPTLTEVNLTASFTAVGGNFDLFSHIVVLRGANLTNITTLNGNNRGDTTGTIVYIEPVQNTANPGLPLLLQPGITYNYSFKLLSSDEVI
jgi:hypothetical protein